MDQSRSQGKKVLNFRSVADMNRDIVSSLHRIDRRAYDVIVGIPRSGMIPASIMATHLQLPLSDVEMFARGQAYGKSGSVIAVDGCRVLLVDDTSNRGGAMARAYARIAPQARSITRCAVYGPYRDDYSIIDMFFAECPGPRAFQWNMWKHARMQKWAFDLDGVFCRDPLKDENDDGDRYLKFMEGAEARFIPTRVVGHVVTCRLEKYRVETQRQLRRLGVQFDALHMMQYATKAERMAAGGRGQWKAQIARETGVEFFVESNPKQASIIAREAQIPVWCIETQELHKA